MTITTSDSYKGRKTARKKKKRGEGAQPPFTLNQTTSSNHLPIHQNHSVTHRIRQHHSTRTPLITSTRHSPSSIHHRTRSQPPLDHRLPPPNKEEKARREEPKASGIRRGRVKRGAGLPEKEDATRCEENQRSGWEIEKEK
ncbi:hypothetical protein Droror1_Dr00019754 [Drosera rotundifolia]